MAQLKLIPINKSKIGGTGSKKPTFGYIYLDPNTHETYRVGFAVYEELLKEIDTNVIPTIMAAEGFTPDNTELTDIAVQIADHFDRDLEIIEEQINYVVKLFDVSFPVQRRIIENNPFTRISLLNKDQLEFVNEELDISLEYVTYEAAMKRIFNKENMTPIFKSLGVNTAPDYVWSNKEEKPKVKIDLSKAFQLIRGQKQTKEKQQ